MILTSTDSIEIVTSAAQALDVVADWADLNGTTVTPGMTPSAISTATTTTVVAAPSAGQYRKLMSLTARNKGSATNDVTVRTNRSATTYERHKVTLQPGDVLQWERHLGFYVPTAPKIDAKLRVTADVVNATVSLADVTGLTQPVKSGKHYAFEAHLYHVTNATTTGAQFAINGPTMTAMRVSTISTVTGSATAAVLSAPVADITARDTVISVQTTGAANVVLTILSGWINPSADGTFAVRCASEVAVASGLTVKQGSWCRIWETDS